MLNLKLKNALFVLPAALLFLFNSVFSQTQYTNTSDSRITVKGTSTLHDWTMEAIVFDCAVLINEITMDEAVINKVSFSLQIENLKSDKNALDKNAYKALKTKEIQFLSTTIENVKISSNQINGIITGNLTVAGTTKSVSFPFDGIINNVNQMESHVIYKINMKDFNIDPPTYFLGALKTGPVVDIIIHLKLQTL